MSTSAAAVAGTPPSKLEPASRAALHRATYENIGTFADLVFSESFETFTRGPWVRRRLEFLASSNKTCDIGPRNHLKSTGFYVYIAWKIWRARFNAIEGCEWADGPARLEMHYFSYKQKSAGYHIGVANDSIKNLLARNPWFAELQDLKPTAETKAKWTWDGKHDLALSPHGMLSHVRGIHADIVFIDDPFQDPENDLNPTEVLKINNVFRAGVSSIPKTEDGDEIHVTTTPQTTEDFTFDEDLMASYAHVVQPAITDHATESVIWPEWMTYADLMARKREIGPKLFAQEFMCSPKASEVGFFTDEEVGRMIEPELPSWGDDRSIITGDVPAPLRRWLDSGAMTGVVAGLDIGKKRHPSHLAVFAVLRRWLWTTDDDSNPVLEEEPAGHLVQIHEKWMDEWNYTRQVEYCRRAIDYFDVDVLPYDNTRGEFESLDEQDKLPPEMDPVSLSGSSKDSMAGAFDIYGAGGRLKLLPSGRQKRQLTVVTNDLDAVETSEGHGEPFTSIGLAVWQAQKQHWGSRFSSLEM